MIVWLKPKRYRLSIALCCLHGGSQINPQINKKNWDAKRETNGRFLSNAAAALTASATAQISKRVLRAHRYKTLWLNTLWVWDKNFVHCCHIHILSHPWLGINLIIQGELYFQSFGTRLENVLGEIRTHDLISKTLQVVCPKCCTYLAILTW